MLIKNPKSPRALEIMAAVKLVHLALVPAMAAVSFLQIAAHRVGPAAKADKQK